MGERLEALIRIPIFIICYLILQVWEFATVAGTIFHWIFVLVSGRRIRALARFSNLFATYEYTVIRYIYFAANKRPFPFAAFPEEIEPEKKRK